MRFVCVVAIVIVIVVVLGYGLPVRAQQNGALISGAYLYEICKRNSGGQEVVAGGHATCQAYIAGIIDYHNLIQSLGTAPSVNLCVPPQIKLSDLQDIVWRYLERNTHHDAFIAAPAVTLALFEVFPCG